MPVWERVDGESDNPRFVAAAAWSVVGLLPLCGVFSDIGWAVVAVPFAALWQVVVWRSMLIGIYVGEDGIKVRSHWRTSVVPWARVERVWAGPADGYDAWQIWVTAREPHRDIPTPVWRRGSRAAARSGNHIVLPPDEFSAALAALDPSRRRRAS
ncbi:hypothetical protein O7635_26015 [Asanoa sp. WMMD1127]|uniref:hypothetical protein n=1 Tax=Asanoa sp. WMMD1127 TaxID=3016107 RepID=UPI002417CB07|nr:hypothetical protein [Asanoa sp. WMMD1127]MDG4825318.1 hypothetical protein [Asanoa sp. WMMD1127]